MRQTAHYFHDAKKINLKLVKDDRSGDEALQMIIVDEEENHSVVNVLFKDAADIDRSQLG